MKGRCHRNPTGQPVHPPFRKQYTMQGIVPDDKHDPNSMTVDKAKNNFGPPRCEDDSREGGHPDN